LRRKPPVFFGLLGLFLFAGLLLGALFAIGGGLIGEVRDLEVDGLGLLGVFRFQLLAQVGVGGVGGEVLQFIGVGLEVEDFGPFVMPRILDQFGVGGTDGGRERRAEALFVEVAVEEALAPVGGLLFQEGLPAASVHGGGHRLSSVRPAFTARG